MLPTSQPGSQLPPPSSDAVPGTTTVSDGPCGRTSSTLTLSPGRAAVVYEIRHVCFSSAPILR